MRAAVLAVLVACGGPWMAAQEMTGSTVVSRVIALENAWNRASEAKDLKALDQILDDAFVYVSDDGRLLTKAEVLKDVKESRVQRVVMESVVVHVHGETAIATGTFKMNEVVRGKSRVRQGRFVDAWLHTNGRWASISSIGIPIE